ncbi:MAG: radical SAM protein [Acidobacteriota bacterium]
MKRRASRQVNLYLIKPSRYDDEGYVVRHFRGVLPSNTLFCLASLTRHAAKSERFADTEFRIELLDETVSKVNCRKICRSQTGGSKTIVCLVGVQTHQFPRASDLAKVFREAGLTVLLGGFHVSGYLSMIPEVPADIQELLDLGVTVVKGEVEESWNDLLEDAIQGRLQPLYDFTSCKPDLHEAPIPSVEKRVLRKFVSRKSGTIDCGRGCPFNCSFCTIINVQGRKMRFRSPSGIADAIRENYKEHGIYFYFFTDDNFARNMHWEDILDEMIALREVEKLPIEFMMQVDVLSYRITGFVEKAKRAGCSNVFIGMESVNDQNLKAAGKRQNHFENYRDLIQTYRDAGIATHVGYIFGFPFDTPESIRRDLDRLMNDVQVEMASFFIMTPLPGSRDHYELYHQGAYMDPDYNVYDSQHVAMEFPNFETPQQLQDSYQEAWETFYGFTNMKRILKRAPKRTYWNLFRNFLWYKSAAVIEKSHPMMTGLVRLKGRKNLRPGIQPLSRTAYLMKRFREFKELTFATLQLLLEMQLLWLETREKSQTEQRVLEELRQLSDGTSLRVGLREVQAAYSRACEHLPNLRVPSRFRLFLRKWNPFSLFEGFYSTRDVLEFWRRTLAELQRGRFGRVSLTALTRRFLLDSRVSIHFAAAWMRNLASH